MAWVSTTEIQSGRDGEYNVIGIKKFFKVYRVIFDAPVNGPFDALSVPGLPARFSSYVEASGTSADIYALAMDGRSKPEDPENLFVWLVTINFDTSLWERIKRRAFSSGKGEPSNPSDPVDGRSTEIEFGQVRMTRALQVDLNGVAIQNSAK